MNFQYIDTHAHLNLAQFGADRNEVIEKNRAEDVACINIGTHKQTSELSLELAQQNEDMRSIVGLHPINVLSKDPDDPASVVEPEFDYDFYKQLAQHEHVVGIGECGFDYFHNSDDTYEAQREAFVAQIALANEVQKPLMLHLRSGREVGGRNAYTDALDILKTEAKVVGNAHFYAGSWEQAKAFFDIGFTISFTGVITFTHDYEQIVKDAPLDMIHGETDCPYVAPKPHRGKRCEPWMVKQVYKKIAELKNQDEELVRLQLLQNARDLYSL